MSAALATGLYVALLAVLCLRSHPRVTGDGAEYILLAERFAQGQPPHVPVADARARGLFEPRLVDRTGAQQLWHFWLFPLLVSPVTRLVGQIPTLAFTIVNVSLLGLAFLIVCRRAGAWAALFVCCSPILWWVDKAQVEVFTVALIAIGCALIAQPHLAAVAFALAATQNPPFAIVSLALCVAALRISPAARGGRGERRDRDDRSDLGDDGERRERHAGRAGRARRTRARVWGWCALAICVCLLHPLFYLWRLGRWTPLVETADARIPGLHALLTVIADLNVGMMVHAPLVLIIVGLSAAAAVIAAGRPAAASASASASAGRGSPAFFGGITLLLLIACAQAPNVNSGGTPGMSRYALWFIPLPLLLWPVLASQPASARLLRIVTIASAGWSLLFFPPALPEHYLSPTRIAAWVWSRHPSWDHPLPEIFAERLRHRDGVNTLAATPDCAKALALGGQWPAPCEPGVLPDTCRAPGALCYANRRPDGSYGIVETSRRGGIRLSAILP